MDSAIIDAHFIAENVQIRYASETKHTDTIWFLFQDLKHFHRVREQKDPSGIQFFVLPGNLKEVPEKVRTDVASCTERQRLLVLSHLEENSEMMIPLYTVKATLDPNYPKKSKWQFEIPIFTAKTNKKT